MATQPQRAAGEAELRAEVCRLQEEVSRLQHRLGALHATDLNSLRRAYAALCQHVEALEGEASGMTAALHEFEVEVVPPQLVAKELGVAAALAFGLGLLRATVRALPLRAAQSPAITRGLWLLGGAVVLSRLTGGALAHVAALMGRNANRKRRLLRQLEEVQERISIMAALQQWSEPQAAAAPPAAAAAQEEAGSGAEGEGGGQPGGAAAPTRASPASSSGGSGELVERPEYDEEVEKADAGTARSEAATPPRGPASEGAGRGRAGSQGAFGGQPKSGARVAEPADPALATLAKYAQLGEK